MTLATALAPALADRPTKRASCFCVQLARETLRLVLGDRLAVFRCSRRDYVGLASHPGSLAADTCVAP